MTAVLLESDAANPVRIQWFPDPPRFDTARQTVLHTPVDSVNQKMIPGMRFLHTRYVSYFCLTLLPITSDISVMVTKAEASASATSFFTLGIWKRFTTK